MCVQCSLPQSETIKKNYTVQKIHRSCNNNVFELKLDIFVTKSYKVGSGSGSFAKSDPGTKQEWIRIGFFFSFLFLSPDDTVLHSKEQCSKSNILNKWFLC